MKHGLIIGLILLAGCQQANDNVAQLASDISVTDTPSSTWASGGNLHAATALEWQQASFQNRRATTHDFILALFEQQQLIYSQLDQDSVKNMSERLALQLNQQFKVSGTAYENQRTFQHRKVSAEILLLAEQNGWLK